MVVIARVAVIALGLILSGNGIALAGDPTLNRVILSSGGVGYFEYAAEVEGDTTLGLDVPLDQVDDILKSLVVFDSAGGIAGVELPGRDNTIQAFGAAPFYRSFDHGQVARVCGELRKATLRDFYKQTLKRTAVSADMRRFADGLLALQQKRHHADYNPTALFSPADALDAVTEAEAATAAFHRVPEDEQSDVLALMMVRLRD
jgi:hypothetical protein